MSQAKFQEAKNFLSFSQALRDRLNPTQQPQDMAQPQQDMSQPQNAPQTPQDAPQQPNIQQAVQEAMAPFMEEIKGMLEKQAKEEQAVELKIDGQMTPKA